MKQLAEHGGTEQAIAQVHGAPVHGEPPGEAAPSLREFLSVLRRRRAIALQTLIVIAALGTVLTMMTKPTYLSTARVLVEGKAAQLMVNNNGSPLSNLFLPSAGQRPETQVEILRSSSMVNRAYKLANLAPGTVNLEVKRSGETDVIDLSATSTSATAPQALLEALPKVYLEDRRTNRMSEVAAALKFAQGRLNVENEKLRQSELKLERFKQQADVIDPDTQVKAELEATSLARQSLAAAQDNASSVRAQLDSLIATRRGLPAQIERSTTSSNTAAIQALQTRIDDLKSERARLLFLYKESDDEVRKVDRQIAELQERLARTPREVTTTDRVANPALAEYDAKIAEARTSLQAAQANLSTLQKRAQTLGGGLTRFNPLSRQIAQLERAIKSSTESSATMAQSVDDLTLRQKALESANDPISTIEPASPGVKIAPDVKRNIILAVALGVLLGCGAAMLQESLDDHIRDEDEARRLLGTPVLGHFPMMSDSQKTLLPQAARLQAGEAAGGGEGMAVGYALNGDGTTDLKALSSNGDSSNRSLLEKFRVLRSNVQFTLIDRAHTTILITSSAPQEGKSYTAANLAVAMAMDGRRVILVDADLHRPRAHETFEVPLQPGLTNILVGQAQIENCLRETSVPGLRLLTAGVLPPNPVELLNSPTMEALMDGLREQADMLIFDSPPLLATADAQVLASKVDGVLYVMQLGRVPKSSVRRSFELLQQARANVIGIVLNKMDDKSSRSSYYSGYNGYGGYGGYHSGDYRDEPRNGQPPAHNSANGHARPNVNGETLPPGPLLPSQGQGGETSAPEARSTTSAGT